MKKASKSTPSASEPARRQAVIYARVSSKEQEKEGFSIPAQLKLLKVFGLPCFRTAVFSGSFGLFFGFVRSLGGDFWPSFGVGARSGRLAMRA